MTAPGVLGSVLKIRAEESLGIPIAVADDDSARDSQGLGEQMCASPGRRSHSFHTDCHVCVRCFPVIAEFAVSYLHCAVYPLGPCFCTICSHPTKRV